MPFIKSIEFSFFCKWFITLVCFLLGRVKSLLVSYLTLISSLPFWKKLGMFGILFFTLLKTLDELLWTGPTLFSKKLWIYYWAIRPHFSPFTLSLSPHKVVESCWKQKILFISLSESLFYVLRVPLFSFWFTVLLWRLFVFFCKERWKRKSLFRTLSLNLRWRWIPLRFLFMSFLINFLRVWKSWIIQSFLIRYILWIIRRIFWSIPLLLSRKLLT